MKRRHARRLALLLFLLINVQCSYPPIELTRLEGGGSLKDLTTSNGLYVALVLHPQECLQCLSSLSQWVDARRKYPQAPFGFLLSRPVTTTESATLRLHRIPIDGVFAGRIPIDGLTGFHALVFQDGALAFSRDIRGPAASDSLLQSLGLDRRSP